MARDSVPAAAVRLDFRFKRDRFALQPGKVAPRGEVQHKPPGGERKRIRPHGAVPGAVAVMVVPEERVAKVGHVRADLVRAPGDELDFAYGAGAVRAQHAVLR